MRNRRSTTLTKSEVRRQQLLNMPFYLKELQAISGKKVRKEDLTSLEESSIIQEKSLKKTRKHKIKIAIPFSTKSNEKIKSAVSLFYSLNSAPIYIWTPRSKYCGTLKEESIKNINLNFPFDINKEGVIVFITDDLQDKILFDFFESNDGKKMLEIEIEGNNWPKALLKHGSSPLGVESDWENIVRS